MGKHAAVLAIATALTACAGTSAQSEPDATSAEPPTALADFLSEQVALLEPIQHATNLTWFEASVTGTDAAFAKSRAAEDELNRFLADPQRFARVRTLRDDGSSGDPIDRRQLEVLYLSMLGKQVDPALLEKITALQSTVEQAFNTYRGKVAGKEVTQNEILEVLRESTDSKELQAAWEAQKDVGVMVAPKLEELVRLRNQVARALGFRDYYALRIAESEQNEQDLLALFDELDRLTREPFLRLKAQVDARLAKRLGIAADALMPWHYQNPFFQKPPAVFDTGLDAVYKQQDTLAVCRTFYEGIGLEVKDIIARSDLYEKEGKTPHAFSTDIDRSGDIRVIANIVPGLEWQTTMIHELGHAVYDESIDPSLPWLLREAAHPLTTEGLAMMLDRLVASPRWAEQMQLISAGAREKAMAEAKTYLAFAPLQFSRWTQVMLRFERELYRDPEQDLNTLWWDLVEKYQGLRRPAGRDAPDYASKIHLVIVPVYYHNYMMGELFGAQIHEAIAKTLGESPFDAVYVGHPEAGEFLRTRVFAPGARYSWNELTERVTGAPLSPAAFARRFED